MGRLEKLHTNLNGGMIQDGDQLQFFQISGPFQSKPLKSWDMIAE
jgi:hypothetical protein